MGKLLIATLLVLALSPIASSEMGLQLSMMSTDKSGQFTKAGRLPDATPEEKALVNEFFRAAAGKDFTLSEYIEFDRNSIDQSLYNSFELSMRSGCISEPFMIFVKDGASPSDIPPSFVAFAAENGCNSEAYAVTLRRDPDAGWRILSLKSAIL